MKKLLLQRFTGFLLLGLCSFSIVFGLETETIMNEESLNPVELLLLDNQTTSSLENVDFVMQVSPQVVTPNTVVDYYFQIQNLGTTAVENARLTHVLPRGLSFIGFDLLGANALVETTNYPNDTLVIKGMYFAAEMETAFVLNAQVLVADIDWEGFVTNQAVLDVVTANGEDSIVSDANPTTAESEEQTMLVVQAISNTSDSNNIELLLSPKELQMKTIVLNSQKISAAVQKAASRSGKNNLRWAGMTRDDFLKPGATMEQSKALTEKINNGRAAQVKTYVDRYGKTKLYTIVPGKLPITKFASAIKSRPTYRSSLNSVSTKNIPVVSNAKLTINRNISRTNKVSQYNRSFSQVKPKTSVNSVGRLRSLSRR